MDGKVAVSSSAAPLTCSSRLAIGVVKLSAARTAWSVECSSGVVTVNAPDVSRIVPLMVNRPNFLAENVTLVSSGWSR